MNNQLAQEKADELVKLFSSLNYTDIRYDEAMILATKSAIVCVEQIINTVEAPSHNHADWCKVLTILKELIIKDKL